MSGLRSALLRKPELFVGTLTEKLLTYALGRGHRLLRRSVGSRDRPGRADKDYRFSSLVLGIV